MAKKAKKAAKKTTAKKAKKAAKKR